MADLERLYVEVERRRVLGNQAIADQGLVPFPDEKSHIFVQGQAVRPENYYTVKFSEQPKVIEHPIGSDLGAALEMYCLAEQLPIIERRAIEKYLRFVATHFSGIDSR